MIQRGYSARCFPMASEKAFFHGPIRDISEPERAQQIWSLPQVLAWIEFRKAVTGPQNRQLRSHWPFSTVNPKAALLQALQQGSIRAIRFGSELPTSAWTNAGTSLRKHAISFRRRDVQNLWPPDPLHHLSSSSSMKARMACRAWLLREMRASTRHQPRPQREYWAEAKDRWPLISKRSFLTAWTEAARFAGAQAWVRGGRPRALN